MLKGLEKLGMKLISGKKHWKLEYGNVRMPMSKTTSDYRSGLNSSADIDLLNAINMLGNTGFIISLFTYLALFLIGGYLFYSAIYAAIGSAVDNIQDASQLQSLAMVPIILGLVFSMSAVSDPNSGMAFTMSIVPFTSPMVRVIALLNSLV